MGWYRSSESKAAASVFRVKASISALLMSIGLNFFGLSGCRGSDAKNVSEPFVSTCVVTNAMLIANVCLNYLIGPQSSCFLRLHGYRASDKILAKAQVELGPDQTWISRGGPWPEFEGNITTVELQSINDYSRSGYGYINRALRGDYERFTKLEGTIYAAASGLNKLKKFEGEVYRSEIVDLDMLDAITKSLQVGNLVIERSFLSTSRLSDLEFAGYPFGETKVKLNYKIKSKTARDLKGIANNYEKEQEVLFLPGSVFRVLSVLKEEGPTYRFETDAPLPNSTYLKIEMEEVDLEK